MPDQKVILERTIDELKRVYDWLDQAYVRLKTKTLTFLGAELGTLTFLYASGNTFLPKEVYGLIFYFVGLGLMLTALTLLVLALLPRHWEFSIEITDIRKIKFPSKKDYLASELAYLDYVKERYITAYDMNIKVYEDNHKLVNIAFFPLIIGAIILVVLKIFGA